MEQQLIQLGVSGATLLIMFLLGKMLIEKTDKNIHSEREISCKERDEYRKSIDTMTKEFTLIITNHITHSTLATDKNSRALDSNSKILKRNCDVLDKVLKKL